MTDLHIKSAI